MEGLELEEQFILQEPSKVSFETCIKLQNLYNEYKNRYKQFFESLVQKNDDELKMLTFRLDFNEYYADRYYEASDLEFKFQTEYKDSINQSDANISLMEEIKEPQIMKGESRLQTTKARKVEPEERKVSLQKPSSSTRILKGSRDNSQASLRRDDVDDI